MFCLQWAIRLVIAAVVLAKVLTLVVSCRNWSDDDVKRSILIGKKIVKLQLPCSILAQRWWCIHHHVVNYKLTFRISPSTTSTQIIPVHTLYTIMPSEVQVTTLSLSQKSKSANNELILLFEHCLQRQGR